MGKRLLKEIELEKNSILLDTELTNIKKNAFVNEIRSGLGDIIKNTPNTGVILKEPITNRLGKFFKKILTAF